MPEPVSLDQIFGAFVRQETLEDAAIEMASFAKSSPGLVDEIKGALLCGIASNDGRFVVNAVNQSGYRVSDASEAKRYCVELLDLFAAQISNGA